MLLGHTGMKDGFAVKEEQKTIVLLVRRFSSSNEELQLNVFCIPNGDHDINVVRWTTEPLCDLRKYQKRQKTQNHCITAGPLSCGSRILSASHCSLRLTSQTWGILSFWPA